MAPLFRKILRVLFEGGKETQPGIKDTFTCLISWNRLKLHFQLHPCSPLEEPKILHVWERFLFIFYSWFSFVWVYFPFIYCFSSRSLHLSLTISLHGLNVYISEVLNITDALCHHHELWWRSGCPIFSFPVSVGAATPNQLLLYVVGSRKQPEVLSGERTFVPLDARNVLYGMFTARAQYQCLASLGFGPYVHFGDLCQKVGCKSKK